MLSQSPNDEIKSIVVSRQPIEVVVNEDGIEPLSLVMPPFEDLAEINDLRGSHFSMREHSERTLESFRPFLKTESARLKLLASKFRESPTYWNRLANIAAISGDFEDESYQLRTAQGISSDQFFIDRMVENLLNRNLTAEASEELARSNFSQNIYANLRMASLLVRNGDIKGASEYVRSAIEIEPLDYGARLFEGGIHLWSGENELAIHSFRLASASRPNSAVLHTNMAAAYVASKNWEKAFKCLKMAVAIDPLNTNAVNFLSDVASSLKRSEEAIPSLRLFLKFEQKNGQVWEKLARALFNINQFDEAISAIKRSASIKTTPGAWNNIGVCYFKKGDKVRALESFKQCLTTATSVVEYSYCLAAKNAAHLLENSQHPLDAVRLIDQVVNTENWKIFIENSDLSMIFLIKLQSLIRAGKIIEATEFGELIISQSDVGAPLRANTLTSLLFIYSLHEELNERALALANEYSEFALLESQVDERSRRNLLNNIAFVFAENNLLDRAELHLHQISGWIHRDPYPTATSGLVHFKKGHTDKAENLYSEALNLCIDPSDKARIRQKWNLEIGKSLIDSDSRRALKYFQKAAEEKRGDDGIAKSARRRIKSLISIK